MLYSDTKKVFKYDVDGKEKTFPLLQLSKEELKYLQKLYTEASLSGAKIKTIKALIYAALSLGGGTGAGLLAAI